MKHDDTNGDESTDVDERDVRALTECASVLDDVGRARRADDLYLVVSESGREYLVDDRVGACECPDYEYREPEGGCKHVRRVAFATGAREIPDAVAQEVDELLGVHVHAEADRIVTDGGVAVAADGAGADDDDDVPADYCHVEKPNGEEQWLHEGTGLCVDLLRFARPTQMHDPETSRIDHHEHRLVARPDGAGEPGEPVDRTTDDDHAPVMAREWLRAHPDGEVDLEAEALEAWER